jgi:hypothetical protein
MPHLYVLDHNFPPLAVEVKWPPDLQLVPLTRFGANLANLDDWELLEELHRRGDASGLVTIDGRMLNQPKEMVALNRSRLTLIVTDGAGNNALRATGLLLVHLPAVLGHPAAPPRIFELRPGNLVQSSAGKRINALAVQRNATPPALIEEATREMERLRGR